MYRSTLADIIRHIYYPVYDVLPIICIIDGGSFQFPLKSSNSPGRDPPGWEILSSILRPKEGVQLRTGGGQRDNKSEWAQLPICDIGNFMMIQFLSMQPYNSLYAMVVHVS